MLRPWLLIPVKPLAAGKRRLSAVMGDSARRDLNEFFLRRMLGVAIRFAGRDRTAVISDCRDVIQIAQAKRVLALEQLSNSGLNGAAEEGVARLRSERPGDILLIACDEPLVMPSDLQEVTNLGVGHEDIVICMDKHRTGTNAIFLPSDASLQFCFGENSCLAHQREASRIGRPARVHYNAHIACDIDTAEDLSAWLRLGRNAPPEAIKAVGASRISCSPPSAAGDAARVPSSCEVETSPMGLIQAR